ncbi:MAG: hypothetical protein V9E90_13150 [Saprospiraceae bacterium]|jgi:membrane protein implicated in regulation of membrane protease activity
MSTKSRQAKIILAVVLLTTFLTWFFYAHETLPKPIRAATALIETPVAIASGLSHYLKLGIDVYKTPWTVILTNFLFSVVVVFLVDKFFKRRKQKSALK